MKSFISVDMSLVYRPICSLVVLVAVELVVVTCIAPIGRIDNTLAMDDCITLQRRLVPNAS